MLEKSNDWLWIVDPSESHVWMRNFYCHIYVMHGPGCPLFFFDWQVFGGPWADLAFSPLQFEIVIEYIQLSIKGSKTPKFVACTSIYVELFLAVPAFSRESPLLVGSK